MINKYWVGASVSSPKSCEKLSFRSLKFKVALLFWERFKWVAPVIGNRSPCLDANRGRCRKERWKRARDVSEIAENFSLALSECQTSSKKGTWMIIYCQIINSRRSRFKFDLITDFETYCNSLLEESPDDDHDSLRKESCLNINFFFSSHTF